MLIGNMESTRVREMTFGEEYISTSKDEDKKFVSQAVAFVIGHARNGFVALCASVATLLKEQARLKQENESLRQQLTLLKDKIPAEQSSIFVENNLVVPSSETCVPSPSIKGSKISEISSFPINREIKYSIKDDRRATFRTLDGCLCARCSKAPKDSLVFNAPLKKGDKVVIKGELCGTVQYVGHINSQGFSEIFVGLRLDEAVGDSNGSIGGKSYFTVPERYGLFVPLSYVCCHMS